MDYVSSGGNILFEIILLQRIVVVNITLYKTMYIIIK